MAPAVRPSVAPSSSAISERPSRRSRRVYLGEWVDVPVHDLDALTPGDTFHGPALFESPTTTVLVRESETARVTPHGWLDIALA